VLTKPTERTMLSAQTNVITPTMLASGA
jgi:hypothetical protein